MQEDAHAHPSKTASVLSCDRMTTPVSAQSGHRNFSFQCSEALIAATAADRAKLPYPIG